MPAPLVVLLACASPVGPERSPPAPGLVSAAEPAVVARLPDPGGRGYAANPVRLATHGGLIYAAAPGEPTGAIYTLEPGTLRLREVYRSAIGRATRFEHFAVGEQGAAWVDLWTVALLPHGASTPREATLADTPSALVLSGHTAWIATSGGAEAGNRLERLQLPGLELFPEVQTPGPVVHPLSRYAEVHLGVLGLAASPHGPVWAWADESGSRFELLGGGSAHSLDVPTTRCRGGRVGTPSGLLVADDRGACWTYGGWSDRGSWGGVGCRDAGGPPHGIYRGEQRPTALVVADGHAYFIGAGGRVIRVPRSGGDASVLGSGDDSPSAVAVLDGDAYWANASGEIRRRRANESVAVESDAEISDIPVAARAGLVVGPSGGPEPFGGQPIAVAPWLQEHEVRSGEPPAGATCWGVATGSPMRPTLCCRDESSVVTLFQAFDGRLAEAWTGGVGGPGQPPLALVVEPGGQFVSLVESYPDACENALAEPGSTRSSNYEATLESCQRVGTYSWGGSAFDVFVPGEFVCGTVQAGGTLR